ncbi:hypothetical protein JL722_7467 [Aureococcus anophagefferens]|nr:hypothetical protein JL722_7467 [Aureococcus anophagefferens]
MREIVVFCCLAAGAATVDWRAALDLDETPYVQRARSAGWRADLAAALDFDLASLGSAHALAQSQVSKEGWLATHARWVERSPCGGAAVAGAAPGTERARRDVDGDGVAEAFAAAVHPPYYAAPRAPRNGVGSAGVACRPTFRPRGPVANPLNGHRYDVDGRLFVVGRAVSTDGAPAAFATVELWHADPYGVAPFGGWTPLARAHAAAGTLPAEDHYSPARDGTGCHGVAVADAAGRFSFETVNPGAYGPPQHVELRITGSDAAAPLYTKPSVVAPGPAPGALPRARDFLVNRTLELNVTLAPAPAVASDFSGLWSDGRGFVRVASNGGRFVAVEAPTARTWGAVTAAHAGPYALRGADFRAPGNAPPATGDLRFAAAAAGAGDAIAWSDGSTWTRAHGPDLPTYRYLRLVMTESLRTRPGGRVELDDVVVYGGILGWDVGAAGALAPTALVIKCGARHISLQNVGALDCPRFFVLEGARDGEDPDDDAAYEPIFEHRVWNARHNGAETYGPDGAVFEFAAGTRFLGRAAGERCGSCGADGGCAAAGPDRTCASAYCGGDGLCAASAPACPAGSELVVRSPDDFGCEACAAGRFAAPGASACNGTCAAGFYCPDGSTAATARACGGATVYCPAGSARRGPCPRATTPSSRNAAGGRRAARGSYCAGGVKRPCPAGTYGNETTLASPGCSALCRSPGSSCVEGSVAPERCPPGTFCPGNGAPKYPCPPGTYGENGACEPGYYCPANSTSAREKPCGDVAFLGDGAAVAAYCPGSARRAAAPGHYVAGGAPGRREAQAACGPGFRCARGSRYACEAGTYRRGPGLEVAGVAGARPAPATGDASCDACPPGHYCPRGADAPVPCPPGRWGNGTGLGSPACDGACDRGHYCPAGSLARDARPCPGGTFGNTTGLTTPACSAACVGDAEGRGACAVAACEAGYCARRRRRTARARAACPTCCPDGATRCAAPRDALYARA